MKKIVLLTALFLVTWNSLSAQTSDDNYTPLVREGSEWMFYSPRESTHYKYFIQGDTVVNGFNYKVVYRMGVHFAGNESEEIVMMLTRHGLVREEDKKVYSRSLDYSGFYMMSELINEPTGEYILYDFSDLKKFYEDWLAFYNQVSYGNDVITEVKDTCMLVDRKCYKVNIGRGHKVIEGIGAYYDRYGDVFRRMCIYFASDGSNNQLVSMKNGDGEYEYFNKDLYDQTQLSIHDVNDDKAVDISDVNMLVNVVLGREESTTNCYVTEDSDIDVEDVNSVINYLLGKD